MSDQEKRWEDDILDGTTFHMAYRIAQLYKNIGLCAELGPGTKVFYLRRRRVHIDILIFINTSATPIVSLMGSRLCWGQVRGLHSPLRRSGALKRAGCSTFRVVCALPVVRRLLDSL